MMDKLKKAINSHWARSKAFRIIVIAALFLFMSVSIFLLYWYARLLLGHVFDILIIVAIVIFGYVARKRRYVKQVSPKVRRVEVIACSGLFTSFAFLTTLTVLFGPIPYPHSFLLFLILIVVGAYVGDIVGRKLRWVLAEGKS
jgi:uncharacterized membrane protein YfcA